MDGQDGGEQLVVTVITYPDPVQLLKHALVDDTPVRRVGVQDKFGCSGPAWDLLKEYGLDAATICKTAKEMLGK